MPAPPSNGHHGPLHLILHLLFLVGSGRLADTLGLPGCIHHDRIGLFLPRHETHVEIKFRIVALHGGNDFLQLVDVRLGLEPGISCLAARASILSILSWLLA